MRLSWQLVFLTTLIAIIYGWLLYLQLTMQLRLDFSSFYASALAYTNNTNPFGNLNATFLATPVVVPANLNPPAFLALISPITHLPFLSALPLWFIVSLILGALGAMLCVYLIMPKACFKRNALTFVLFYFAMFATLMNTSIGQIGNLVFFSTVSGYYFFLRRKEYWAGLLWGFIIAIKLFPGLLFLFVLSQKRYKVFFTMCVTCLFLTLLPLLSKGTEVYFMYLNMLSRNTWYGSSWNGSLFGLGFRLLVNQPMVVASSICYGLSLLLLVWYIKKLAWLAKNNNSCHPAFALTIIMMLLLSPLGWLYYFSLLLIPLVIIWQTLNQQSVSIKSQGFWALTLLLINFPTGNTQAQHMDSLLYKLTYYSIYFYGLLVLLFLWLTLFKTSPQQIPKSMYSKEGEKVYLYPVIISLSLGLFVVLANFIYNLRLVC